MRSGSVGVYNTFCLWQHTHFIDSRFYHMVHKTLSAVRLRAEAFGGEPVAKGYFPAFVAVATSGSPP